MEIFVIMPFDDDFDQLYREIVRPACTDRGLPVRRMDEKYEPGDIPQKIIDSIESSYFVIADLSLDNPNVFYELGYAHALNKPIIAIASKPRRLPFDVAGRRTIFYDKIKGGWENRLRTDLGRSIDDLFHASNRFQVNGLHPGDEVVGHFHAIGGRVVGLEGGQHLWLFARRDNLGGLWAPQNDGEIEVTPSGEWRALVYLGWEHESEAIGQWFDLLFGTLDTKDNRSQTERCVRNHMSGDFPPLRRLPTSFRQIALLRVRRIT